MTSIIFIKMQLSVEAQSIVYVIKQNSLPYFQVKTSVNTEMDIYIDREAEITLG